MTDLDALIRDLEAATGPDRGLSDRVLLACGWEKKTCTIDTPFGDDHQIWFEEPTGKRWRLDTGRKYSHPTASLDDALSLVPEGYGWGVNWDTKAGSSELLARANLIHLETRQKMLFPVGAATAPLAVCIAVLKARKEPQ